MTSDYISVEVVVHRDEDYGATGEKLTDVIAEFQEWLQKIPEEYRAAAKCDIQGEVDWDNGHRVTIKVWYTRKETSMEHGQRLGREQNKRDWEQNKRDREIAEARAILAKHGELKE